MRPSAGGIKKHIFSLLQNKSADFSYGFAGEVSQREQESLQEMGITYYPVSIAAGISLKKDLKAALALYQICKKENYQIIHCHGFKAALPARIAAFFAQKKVVYTVHNSIWHENVSGFKRKIASLIERLFAKLYTQQIIAVSENLKQELILKHGVNEKKIKVIPNGVEVPLVYVRQEHSPLIIGTLARFAPQKGLSFFIEALYLLKEDGINFQAVIGGDGPLKEELVAKVKTLGLGEIVQFPGYIQDPQNFYHSIDIFVLPSLSEGLPLTILEAMSQKLPVVATQVGGIPEVIKSGENGILVPPQDAVSLKEALLALITREELRKKLGEKAYLTVYEHYNIEVMARNTEEIYRRLLK